MLTHPACEQYWQCVWHSVGQLVVRPRVSTKVRFFTFAIVDIYRKWVLISRNIAEFHEISRNFAKFRNLEIPWNSVDTLVRRQRGCMSSLMCVEYAALPPPPPPTMETVWVGGGRGRGEGGVLHTSHHTHQAGHTYCTVPGTVPLQLTHTSPPPLTSHHMEHCRYM